jgi:flagellar protein FlbD
MIKLTTLKGNAFYLNDEMIYKIEELPNTHIVLNDDKSIWVAETPEEIIEKIVEYRRRCFYSLPEVVKDGK